MMFKRATAALAVGTTVLASDLRPNAEHRKTTAGLEDLRTLPSRLNLSLTSMEGTRRQSAEAATERVGDGTSIDTKFVGFKAYVRTGHNSNTTYGFAFKKNRWLCGSQGSPMTGDYVGNLRVREKRP